MKKYIIVLVLVLSLFIIGCNNKENKEEEKEEDKYESIFNIDGEHEFNLNIALEGDDATSYISLDDSRSFIEKLNSLKGLLVDSFQTTSNDALMFKLDDVDVIITGDGYVLYNGIYKVENNIYSSFTSNLRLKYKETKSFEEVSSVEIIKGSNKYEINSTEKLEIFNELLLKNEYNKVNKLNNNIVKYELKLNDELVIKVYESYEFSIGDNYYESKNEDDFRFLDNYNETNTDSNETESGWLGWI